MTSSSRGGPTRTGRPRRTETGAGAGGATRARTAGRGARRRPRLRAGRRGAAHDPDRHGPPRRRVPHDALPPLAGRPHARRRPDDPRMGRRGDSVEPPDDGRPVRPRAVDGLVAGVAAFREHPLFRKIVEVDPELLLPYLLERRGASQDALLDLSRQALGPGTRTGPSAATTRPGRPASVLLVVSPSRCPAPTMTDDATRTSTPAAFDEELRQILERYSRRERHRPPATSLNARAARANSPSSPPDEVVDVLVVGLGATGAGVGARRRLARPVGRRDRRPRPGLRHVAGGAPSSSTAGCATSRPGRSTWRTRARSSAGC